MNGEETNLLKKIMLRLGNGATRLFRNNVGTAWIGESVRLTKTQTLTLHAGTVVIKNARIFHGGLCVGSHDLIGLHSVIVNEKMIGKKIAVFVSIEGKIKGGRVSKEQTAFLNMVNELGGISFVAYSEEEAATLINSKNE